MQMRENQLARHLQGGDFQPVYLVTGDEQLLVDEACDAIIAAAKAQGFDERTVFEAVPRADWRELFAKAANLSLFATKRLLDVRLLGRGVDRAGSDALRRYLGAPLDDTLLLCRAVGFEWRQRSSAWYKAIDKAGVVLATRPVTSRDLPRWLEGRCRAAGVQLEPDAVDALAERVEGNLLAAKQEIDKLKLLNAAAPISAKDVADAVGDSAHFGTFEMIDAALAGQAARTRRMARTLRDEGVAVFMILGALANNLRRLRELGAGGRPRMPRSRVQIADQAVRRLGAGGIDALLQECALLDLQAKGMLRGDAWQSLERILLSLAGRLQPSGLTDEAEALRVQAT